MASLDFSVNHSGEIRNHEGVSLGEEDLTAEQRIAFRRWRRVRDLVGELPYFLTSGGILNGEPYCFLSWELTANHTNREVAENAASNMAGRFCARLSRSVGFPEDPRSYYLSVPLHALLYQDVTTVFAELWLYLRQSPQLIAFLRRGT
jgi:hypothetical protein